MMLKADNLTMYFCYADNHRLIGIVVVRCFNHVLHFVGAAGAVLGEWERLDADFVKLAKKKQCYSIQFHGRRGFLKTFKRFGMREKYTVMERVLTNV